MLYNSTGCECTSGNYSNKYRHSLCFSLAAVLQYVFIKSSAVIVSSNLQNLLPHSIPASSLCSIKEREWKEEREKRQKERIPRSAVCFSYCCQLKCLIQLQSIAYFSLHAWCLIPICEYESLSQRDGYGNPPQCSAGSAHWGMWSVSDFFLSLLDSLPFRSFAATPILMPHNTGNVFCMLLCTEVQCEGKTMWTFVCNVCVWVSYGAQRLCHVATQVVVASMNCHTRKHGRFGWFLHKLLCAFDFLDEVYPEEFGGILTVFVSVWKCLKLWQIFLYEIFLISQEMKV